MKIKFYITHCLCISCADMIYEGKQTPNRFSMLHNCFFFFQSRISPFRQSDKTKPSAEKWAWYIHKVEARLFFSYKRELKLNKLLPLTVMENCRWKFSCFCWVIWDGYVRNFQIATTAPFTPDIKMGFGLSDHNQTRKTQKRLHLVF